MEGTVNTSDVEECVVNGGLSLTLRLSRYAGIAPLRFVPHRNGYKISVSYYHAIYNYVLVTAIHIIGCTALLMEVVKQISFISWEKLFHVLAFLATVILCSRGSYYGVNRMKKMIAHLKCLEKITNVGRDNRVKRTQNTASTKIFIFNLCAKVIVVLSQLKLHWNDLMNNPVKMCLWPLHLESITIHILQAQLFFMLLEIQSSLDTIKNKMEEMLSTNAIVTPPSSMLLDNIRSLTRAYVTVCDIVFEVSNEDGIIILVAVFYFITRVVNIGCAMASSLFMSSQYAHIVTLVIWCILNGIEFLAFIESLNYIANEVTHIKVRLSKLMPKVTPIGHHIPIELDLMYKQLNLNKMTISPLSIFTVERTLTIKILSGVVTYFFFVIQIK